MEEARLEGILGGNKVEVSLSPEGSSIVVLVSTPQGIQLQSSIRVVGRKRGKKRKQEIPESTHFAKKVKVDETDDPLTHTTIMSLPTELLVNLSPSPSSSPSPNFPFPVNEQPITERNVGGDLLDVANKDGDPYWRGM